MKYKTKTSLRRDQSGIASMVIVILIMTFLSLIVIAMTRDANREQRQALDRQLNSQAFYAAESGVHDAEEYLANTVAAEEQKSTCDPINGANEGDQFPGQTSRVGLDTEDNSIRYSCVLYDIEPNSLIYESSTTESEKVIIKDAQGRVIKSLTFKWRQTSGDNLNFSGCPAGNALPPTLPPNLSNEDCNAGALRTQLIDLSAAAASSRESLIRTNFLAYLMPSSSGLSTKSYLEAGGENTPASQARQGQVWSATCANGECSLKIDNIQRQSLLLHLRSIYKNNTVRIEGEAYGPSGEAQEMRFKDAQVMIDSTGRANDVLKRIQVRKPVSEAAYRNIDPEFALQTGDNICKLLNVLPPPDTVSNNCPTN